MPSIDRAWKRVRWGRIVPLIALSLLSGLAVGLGLESVGLIPRWMVAPLGNGLGFVVIWMWLPSAIALERPMTYGRRLFAGLVSAIVFAWAMIAASWSDPFWLR